MPARLDSEVTHKYTRPTLLDDYFILQLFETTWLCFVLLVCAITVLLGMHMSSVASISPRTLATFEQVPIFGGSRSFDEGCVLHARGGI